MNIRKMHYAFLFKIVSYFLRSRTRPRPYDLDSLNHLSATVYKLAYNIRKIAKANCSHQKAEK